MNGFSFDVLIDDSLTNVSTVSELTTMLNKYVISIANDFEEGNWRYSKFQSYLWDNIAQTALSARERDALIDQSYSTLISAAKNLRLTDKDAIGQGSEIAEIFLYGLMRSRFKALPVVPKIFYKQNVQDNAKGADSVHIVIEDGDFTLWFGEAKFYNSIGDARLDSIVKSVLSSLSKDKLKKENAIITNVSDLDGLSIDPELRNNIKLALDSQVSIDLLKPKIHIPILILHECQKTANSSEMSAEYKNEIISLHKSRAEAYFKKQHSKCSTVHQYDQITFHLILFPVPSKERIVKAFVNAVAFYKGQDDGDF